MTPLFWHWADSALDRQLCHELACCGDVTIPAGKALHLSGEIDMVTSP
jgi:hypothetical protein